jgi:hypothetical protein
LVGQTDRDLRAISRRDAPAAKDQERYSKALRSLSGLDQALSNDKFDTRQLNASIERINGVAENNALQPQERKTLRADVRNLRALSAGWKSVP